MLFFQHAPFRKKAAQTAEQRSPTAQSNDSEDSSDPDLLPQILAKALAENTDLRNQLLAQLDLVPRGLIKQREINTQSKESPVITGKMEILLRDNQSFKGKAKISSTVANV